MTIPVLPVDLGHVVLGTALIIVIISKLRTAHRRRFTVSFSMKRETLDTAETEQKREGTRRPRRRAWIPRWRRVVPPADDDHDDHDDHHHHDAADVHDHDDGADDDHNDELVDEHDVDVPRLHTEHSGRLDHDDLDWHDDVYDSPDDFHDDDDGRTHYYGDGCPDDHGGLNDHHDDQLEHDDDEHDHPA